MKIITIIKENDHIRRITDSYRMAKKYNVETIDEARDLLRQLEDSELRMK